MTGISAQEAAVVLQRMGHAARPPARSPYPDTIASVKAAYVRGEIEIDELEVRVERLLLAGRDWEPPRRVAQKRPPLVRFAGDISTAWENIMGIPRAWHPPMVVFGLFSGLAGVLDLLT